MKSEELKQALEKAIDDNFVCQTEDHCRKLEWQLDRFESRQKHWADYVNESLNPALTEIRVALRAMRKRLTCLLGRY